jgi:hypothetical protein
MKTWMSLALLLLPAASLAEPAPPAPPTPAQVEKHLRIARTVALAELLDVEPAQALQLAGVLAGFDERKRAAMDQLRQADEALKDIAAGKATSPSVEQLVAQWSEAQAHLQQLDLEMLLAVTRGMSPQQKARAALFLAHPPPPPGAPRPELPGFDPPAPPPQR